MYINLFIMALILLVSVRKTVYCQENAILETTTEIEIKIANKYFDPDKRKLIGIQIKVQTNHNEIFARYIQNRIASVMKNKPQFSLTEKPVAKVDVLVLESRDEEIGFFVSATDIRTDKILFSKLKSYSENDFNMAQYSIYEKKMIAKFKESETKNAFVSIRAINKGKSYKNKDEYYKYTEYNLLGVANSTVFKHDTGHDAYYPLDQICKINGKEYKLGKDKFFVNQNFKPGKFKVETSFVFGWWDNANKQQRRGKKIEKSFTVTLKQNQKLYLDFVYLCSVKVQDVKIIKRQEN